MLCWELGIDDTSVLSATGQLDFFLHNCPIEFLYEQATITLRITKTAESKSTSKSSTKIKIKRESFFHVQGGSDKSGIFFFFLLNGTTQLKTIRF